MRPTRGLPRVPLTDDQEGTTGYVAVMTAFTARPADSVVRHPANHAKDSATFRTFGLRLMKIEIAVVLVDRDGVE
jgi:hypothetical protein